MEKEGIHYSWTFNKCIMLSVARLLGKWKVSSAFV